MDFRFNGSLYRAEIGPGFNLSWFKFLKISKLVLGSGIVLTTAMICYKNLSAVLLNRKYNYLCLYKSKIILKILF